MLCEKENIWGRKLVENVAKDLKIEFPDMQGLSRRNLFNAKKFFQFYDSELVQQAVALIGEQSAPPIIYTLLSLCDFHYRIVVHD